MSAGNIQFLDMAQFGSIGSRKYAVAAGTTSSINPGEPVAKALGAPTVSATATNTPVVATDFLAGISTTTSTETANAAGSVEVMPMIPGVVYLIAPKVAATWDTQAEYDALVGDRVLFDLTSGVYTILATDNAANGLVVEPLDINIYPGKVAFTIRAAVAYNA